MLSLEIVAAWASTMSVQVVIVEKGSYIRAADLSLLERDAFQGMYEGCGLATTDNAGASLLPDSSISCYFGRIRNHSPCHPRALLELAQLVAD